MVRRYAINNIETIIQDLKLKASKLLLEHANCKNKALNEETNLKVDVKCLVFFQPID
jgi:hypothetical protein